MGPEFESLVKIGGVTTFVVAQSLLGASIAGYFFVKQEKREFQERTGKKGRFNFENFADYFSQYHNWKPRQRRLRELLDAPLVVADQK